MNVLARLEKLNKVWVVLVGFALIGAIGLIDYLIGYEVGFSIFYVFPISMVTWLTRRRFGLVASLASALVWLAADIATRDSYLHPLIPVWNTIIRLTFFIIITLLLSALRKATERERDSARIDYLTGAVNLRFFYDLMQMEIDRFQRYGHPFTIAYIDLDHFKAVNDQFGHSVGDQALQTVARSAGKQLRKTDVVARLGGDEFALLLPNTDQESARVVLSKTKAGLLDEMRKNKWPITFSIGALTCSAVPPIPDELLKMADELMYSVKRDSKNAIKYASYAG